MLCVKNGSVRAQDEIAPARGGSAVSKVIDRGHRKIIMRTSLADQTLFTQAGAAAAAAATLGLPCGRFWLVTYCGSHFNGACM